MLGLRYFTMLCKDAEHKKMDQDGKPQSVVRCTELNKDPLQAAKLGLLISYDKPNNLTQTIS